MIKKTAQQEIAIASNKVLSEKIHAGGELEDTVEIKEMRGN